MLTDIVERLRTRNGRADGFGLGPVCDEAADEIVRLRNEIEQLREENAKWPIIARRALYLPPALASSACVNHGLDEHRGF